MRFFPALATSWPSIRIAKNETDAAHGLDQFNVLTVVEFSAQMREMNIDHIIERRRAVRLAPDFACDHLAPHSLIMMLREKREQIELARS